MVIAAGPRSNYEKHSLNKNLQVSVNFLSKENPHLSVKNNKQLLFFYCSIKAKNVNVPARNTAYGAVGEASLLSPSKRKCLK